MDFEDQQSQDFRLWSSYSKIHPKRCFHARNYLFYKTDFREWYFFVRFPHDILEAKGQLKTKVHIIDLNSPDTFDSKRELILVGPAKTQPAEQPAKEKTE